MFKIKSNRNGSFQKLNLIKPNTKTFFFNISKPNWIK